MEFQFLGTGNAAQVPCYGCYCSACERARHVVYYRRTPCSAKIETAQGIILLDAGQTNLAERFPSGSISAVLLTHYHMDHVQGLFHLRWGKGAVVPVFGPDDSEGCDDLFKHPGLLAFRTPLPLFQTVNLAGLDITPLPLNHSKPCVGYYISNGLHSLAYLTDTVGLPEETMAFLSLARPQVLVIDCSYPPRPQPKNHNSLTEALEIIDALKPPASYLTHISHDLDLFLQNENYPLPANVYLAEDNLKIFENIEKTLNQAEHYA